MPPAKIPIAAGVHELEIITVTDRRTIDHEIFEEDSVLRLLVIESERPERRHPCLRFARIPAGAVSKFEQSAFNFRHAAYCFDRTRRGGDRRVELIAKQMLDVINQKLLMLHLVF